MDQQQHRLSPSGKPDSHDLGQPGVVVGHKSEVHPEVAEPVVGYDARGYGNHLEGGREGGMQGGREGCRQAGREADI